VLAPQHPADAKQGEKQTGDHQPAAFLTIKQDGEQDGQAGPQIIDHPHFNGLLTAGGIAQGQREADFIADEQHAAGQQIAARDLAQVRETDGKNQQQAAEAVNHRRATDRSQSFADAANQSDHRAP